MRKITVTLRVNEGFLKGFKAKEMMSRIDYVEGKAMLRLDFTKGIKVVVVEIGMMDGYTLDDLEMPKMAEVVDVLMQKGNAYLCIIKVQAKSAVQRSVFRLFDLDVIYDLPFHYRDGLLTMSFISDNENLELMLKALRFLGVVKDVSMKKAVFSGQDTLSTLTDRQKEIVIEAKRSGYYDLPRKVTTEELARDLGLSKATISEHLRKAENRILSEILAGY